MTFSLFASQHVKYIGRPQPQERATKLQSFLFISQRVNNTVLVIDNYSKKTAFLSLNTEVYHLVQKRLCQSVNGKLSGLRVGLLVLTVKNDE